VEAAVAGLAPAVRALAQLTGAIVEPSEVPEQVKLFFLHKGCLNGPVSYSVVGMRHQNEQSGSSSLFAQPVAIEAVPLAEGGAPLVKLAARDVLEARLEESLAELRTMQAGIRGGTQQTADHLCLFSRWYYRPQTRRVGEVCFADAGGEIAKRPLLRAISRVYRSGQDAS
jgi:excinuclease ABC subunit C